jgi:hypothetical protein
LEQQPALVIRIRPNILESRPMLLVREGHALSEQSGRREPITRAVLYTYVQPGTRCDQSIMAIPAGRPAQRGGSLSPSHPTGATVAGEVWITDGSCPLAGQRWDGAERTMHPMLGDF